jgi:hypothetical protein
MADRRIRGGSGTDVVGLDHSSDRMRMESLTGPPQRTRNQLTQHHHVSTPCILREYGVESVTGAMGPAPLASPRRGADGRGRYQSRCESSRHNRKQETTMAITMNTDLRPIKINLDNEAIWSYDPFSDEFLCAENIYEVKLPQSMGLKMKRGMKLIKVDYNSWSTSAPRTQYVVRINALRRMIQPKFKNWLRLFSFESGLELFEYGSLVKVNGLDNLEKFTKKVR